MDLQKTQTSVFVLNGGNTHKQGQLNLQTNKQEKLLL